MRRIIAVVLLLVAASCTTSKTESKGPVQGVSDTEIKVGVDVIKIPATPTDTRGDTRGIMEAVIADLNAKGGIAGRKVVPTYHVYDLGETFARGLVQQQPAACAHYTEDAKVFAVIAMSYGHDSQFLSCLARRRVLFIESGVALNTEATFRRFPLYFNTSWPNMTRLARITVDLLVDRGFLPKDARVGMVTFDEPQFRAASSVTKKRLLARGRSLTSVIELNRLQSQKEIAAAANGAVLKLKAAGVNRVFGPTLFAAKAAEAQGYRPRYGVHSHDFPAGLVALGIPKEQLRGAVGIGWAPSIDVNDAQAPKPSKVQRRCLDIMKRAGINLPGGNAVRGALSNCEVAWLLKAAVERAGKQVTPESVRRSIERLGDGIEPLVGFRLNFSKDRHDGMAAVRMLAFDDACSCFKYTSGDIEVK